MGWKKFYVRSTVLLMPVLLSACASIFKGDVISQGEPVEGSDGNLVSLNQGWSTEIQAGFWYRGTGSLIIPYDWFLHLEQADSSELFRSDANMERLRYIPIPQSELNPDGLPAGFSKNSDSIDGGDWMALNCGGCHSTKIAYNGTSMIVNGAATMGDFQTFMRELEEAMLATINDSAKFDRFALNVLGNASTDQDKQALRDDFLLKTDKQVEFNHTNRTATQYGFGRVDAFAYAYNNIGVSFLGIPENHVEGVAPTNYNYIWGSAQSDVLQWNGAAPNTPPIAPIFRVLGDVWGGGGKVDLNSRNFPPGYESTADFSALGDMLAWVKILKSPRWPETILPEIDDDRADKGEEHYDEYCAECHQLVPSRSQQMRPYKAVNIPQADVGTDPAMVTLVHETEQQTGALKGTRMYFLAGEKLGETTPAKNLLNIVSIGAMVRHPLQTITQGLKGFTGAVGSLSANPYQYKARPLNGVWATAPYLHNGAVPNLYQLLLPAVQRDKVFYTGNREFNPVLVGQLSAEKEGLFKFDTSIYGNSNAGHEYGTQLSDEQRFELIEFIKTL